MVWYWNHIQIMLNSCRHILFFFCLHMPTTFQNHATNMSNVIGQSSGIVWKSCWHHGKIHYTPPTCPPTYPPTYPSMVALILFLDCCVEFCSKRLKRLRTIQEPSRKQLPTSCRKSSSETSLNHILRRQDRPKIIAKPCKIIYFHPSIHPSIHGDVTTSSSVTWWRLNGHFVNFNLTT